MWSKLQASIPAMPAMPAVQLPQTAGLASSFRSTVQASRERLGQVAPDEITELPQEYKDLEAQVDALKNVHEAMLKITNVYATETYDYPTQITESVADLSSQFSQSFTAFASKNLKGTNLPLPKPTPATVAQPKTLPHALSRAAASGAVQLGADQRLGKALTQYSLAMDKVGSSRLAQDGEIQERFLKPWQATLGSSIAHAVRARNGVKSARLELDSARQILKAAGPAKQEQARLDVENAEDKLVLATETAIGMMKQVLEAPEPIAHLSALVKAQLIFHSSAAEALSAIQGDIEEAAIAAEGEARSLRA